LEWATPILYMQVPDGQLFEFKGARPRTASTTQQVKPAFETNAAKRYAEGEAAMERGDWAAAVIAYRGAMVYVPNYRDAGEKLSICASRSNAATLCGKAQRAIAARDYGAALQALDEAIKLDPTLDVAQLRETAECGEKYQRAISELYRSNRGAGIDLLREVVSVRADFEDAAQRLEDLAAGGNGLFGQTPQPNAMSPNEPPGTPAEQAGWKNRWNQFSTWMTATPEVQYRPAPGTEPEAAANEKDVFDKSRELWNDWFRSKNPSVPLPSTTPQPPVPPPSKKQASPPPAKPVQAQPASPPVSPRKTQPPPNPKTPEPSRPVATQKPADQVLESRIYQTALIPKFVGETICKYFFSQGCETQILQKGGVWVAQGKKVESRQTAGTGLPATIVIERSGPSMRVSIGGGAWIEQGSSVAGDADTAASLITGSIGLENQKALINILWELVERFVAQSGGRRIA
jgi:hypothetical protein